KERGYKEALEKLTESIRDLINTKKREGSYEGILKNWIGELERELRTLKNKPDQDLYKVWLIMLEEELK
ncbi:MAG: hypothetical protein NC821_06450, partial [Candidatus Omnitrophica bacterium]|nr:hypothetical protein [Candidatus Omnitrophota bacterium]